MDHAAIVWNNVKWFQTSGIMRPADGFWGVAERVAIVHGNSAASQIHGTFPAQTRLASDVVALEHRRPDCNAQVALMFDLAADALDAPELRSVADRITDYLLHRSCLQDREAGSPTHDLWGWANPNFRPFYWTDDNAWVATCLLLLARRRRPELAGTGLATARALHAQAAAFLRHIREKGRDVPLEPPPMLGLRLNPHWLGLVTMALAHAQATDPKADYGPFVREYHQVMIGGAPAYDTRSRAAAGSGLPWPLSEYGYLALTASIAGARFKDADTLDVARSACDLLVRNQSAEGHFRAEHYETPAGEHLADLVYTQNWATLGLYHGARLFHSTAYRRAFERSLEFLARIQDTSPEPWFTGCWRGLFDTRAGAWGGGDHSEGGQNSIYSGWTNAPISLAFLLDAMGADFFAEE